MPCEGWGLDFTLEPQRSDHRSRHRLHPAVGRSTAGERAPGLGIGRGACDRRELVPSRCL